MARLLLVTFCFLGGLLLTARAQHKPKIEGPFPARDGETCIVCNGKLTKDDSAFLVDGQRVSVMKEMEDDFLKDPLQYVAKLKPEGGLAHSRQAQVQTGGYLWVGVFVLAGLVFGGACAHMATLKGQSPWRWFLLGFWFSAPATVALALKPNAPSAAGMGTPSTHSPVECAACGGPNHPAATRCSRCGAVMTPLVSSESAG